jgi:hypothetical protein
LKDQIRRSEGDEWEPIKILQENLAYVPNQTQRASLLDEDHIAIEKISALGTELGNLNQRESQDGSSKSMTHESTNKSRE